MRRKLRSLAFWWLACAALGVAGCARGGGGGAARQELQAQYQAMDQAVQARQPDDFMKHVDSTFKLHTASGRTLNFQDVATMISDQAKEVGQDTRSHTTIHDCTVSGDTAEVTAASRQQATYTDAHGAKHQVVTDSTSRDTWKKDRDGWKLILSVETAHRATRDGQAYTPRG